MINQDTIVFMAREAGMSNLSLIDIGYLEKFAALVEAVEREQCALTAWEVVEYEVHADLADQVAQAIRARGRA